MSAPAQTPLMLAASEGNTAQVTALLQAGADVLEKDIRGATALTYAVYGGHGAAAQLLVAHGADPSSRDKLGWTPLRHAANGGHPSLVQLLIDQKVSIDSRDAFEKTPLMYAAAKGCPESLGLLLSAGADIHAFSKTRKTALIYAAMENRTETCRLLLEKGADPNAQDLLGWTALRHASRKNAVEAVTVLLSHGADPNLADSSGKTPLMGAARKNHPAVIQKLISAGANIHACTTIGRTALMFAAFEGHGNVLQLLTQAGARLDDADENGWTAIFHALLGRKKDAAEFLRGAGADVNRADFSGRTPHQLEQQISTGQSAFLPTLLKTTRKAWETFHFLTLARRKARQDPPALSRLIQKIETFDSRPTSTPSPNSSFKTSRSVVAILTYNRWNILKVALDSLKQHVKAPVMIFEDHGFKDETRKHLSTPHPKLQPELETEEHRCPDFTAHLGTSNLGVAGNTNRVLRWFMESDFNHLLLCNDDFRTLGDFPSFYAKAHRDLGIGLFCFCDHQGAEYRPRVMEMKGYTLHLLPRPTGLMMSIPRELVERIGYFDVRYGRYGQEHAGYNHRAGLAGCMTVQGEIQASIDVKPPTPLLANQNVFTALDLPEIQKAYLPAFLHGLRTIPRCKIEGIYQPFRLRKGRSFNKYVAPVNFWDGMEDFQV